jgi:hypothetical protein
VIIPVYSAGKADDLIRIVARKLPKEALELGTKKADEAIRFARRNADNWTRAASSKLDNATRMFSYNADNMLRIGIRHGDDVIYDFTNVHRRVTQTLSTKTDNLARTLVTHTDDAVRVISKTDDLVQSGIKTGGYYGELKGTFKSLGHPGTLAAHHMPAKSAIKGANLWNGDIGKAPAIVMDAADHAKTASFGYSKTSIAYQVAQTTLIKQRRFADALQMDIDDLIAKGLYQKYKSGIDQMMEYIQELRKIGEL